MFLSSRRGPTRLTPKRKRFAATIFQFRNGNCRNASKTALTTSGLHNGCKNVRLAESLFVQFAAQRSLKIPQFIGSERIFKKIRIGLYVLHVTVQQTYNDSPLLHVLMGTIAGLSVSECPGIVGPFEEGFAVLPRLGSLHLLRDAFYFRIGEILACL